MDPIQYRKALGCFATGITVVTAVGPDGELIGITANSFASVSLDPPLVLFSLMRESYSMRAFLATETFAVNILRDDQEKISRRFATPQKHKWAGIGYDVWDTGCPILHDALAKFECKICNHHEGGDHIIFIGEVLRFEYDPKDRPLVFYRGKYQAMSGEE